MPQKIPSMESAWDHDDTVNQLEPQELDNLNLPDTIIITGPYKTSLTFRMLKEKITHDQLTTKAPKESISSCGISTHNAITYQNKNFLKVILMVKIYRISMRKFY